MSLNEVSHEVLQKMITQLEQSLYNHIQWYNSLIRTLICKLPPDRHDIGVEPFKECRFGQWYYDAPSIWSKHPGFVAIGEIHKQMHLAAAHLLNNINRITTHDYDNFANVLEHMRLEVMALIRELENLLYNRDPLTNAINRVNMLPILREQQELAKRDVLPCCIIMMDLDNFKEINDLYGHTAGDTVLIETVKYISQNIRPYDKIFRYGGEEFLLCLPNTNVTNAYELIRRVIAGLSSTFIPIAPDQSVHVRVSCGLASLDPNLPIEQSIEHADKALMAAKSAGKNCIKLWEEERIALK